MKNKNRLLIISDILLILAMPLQLIGILLRTETGSDLGFLGRVLFVIALYIAFIVYKRAYEEIRDKIK